MDKRKPRPHDAVSSNDLLLMQALIKNGADINKGGDPPLCLATQEGFSDMVRLLLENGADLQKVNQVGMRPIHLACRYGHDECLRLLLLWGGEVNQQTDLSQNGDTPLYYAVQHDRHNIVQMLLDAGANVHQRASFLYTGNGPIHAAAYQEDPTVLNQLLAAGADPNMLNEDRKLPLHLAALTGNAAVVERLAACGSKLDEGDTQDFTAVMYAAQAGHAEVVRRLCVAGCSLNACSKDGQTALHIAASHGNTQAMKVLARYGAEVNKRDAHRKTPLHLAIAQCQHKMKDKWPSNIDGISVNREIEMLDTLLQNSADMDMQDDNGDTPLHVCVKEGCVSVLEYLINNNALYTKINRSGHTPLSLACHENTHQAIRLLVQLCPRLVNHPRNLTINRSPLCILMQKQNMDCLRLLNAAGYRYHRDEIDSALHQLNGKRLPHSVSSWLEKEMQQPWSLEKICRTCIRDRLPRQLKKKVHKLPIPQKVVDSVLLKRTGH